MPADIIHAKGELRKDYILDRWVVIASNRAKRPDEFKQKAFEKEEEKVCFFCTGNEDMTPPEIDRMEEDGKWIIRVFPNRFPALELKGDYNIQTHNNYFTFSSDYGKHEILVETPNHDEEFGDLSVDRIKKVLLMYEKRIKAISEIDGMKYVLVINNHRKEAGTSLVHSHSQIFGINKIPTIVEQEMEANKDSCRYCEIIEQEKSSPRAIKEDSCVSFTPYASRFPFEAWIFPKKHISTISELSDQELTDMASHLKLLTSRLQELNAPYNFFIHYGNHKDLHLHIELISRLTIMAGFELGGGMMVNVMPPEDAAKFYRGEAN